MGLPELSFKFFSLLLSSFSFGDVFKGNTQLLARYREGTRIESGFKTLVVDVTSDFAASDSVTISDLSFSNFSAESSTDYLALDINDDATAIIIISNPGIPVRLSMKPDF